MTETNLAVVVPRAVVARVLLAAIGFVVGTAFPIAVGGAAGMLVAVVAPVAAMIVAPVVAGVLLLERRGLRFPWFALGFLLVNWYPGLRSSC